MSSQPRSREDLLAEIFENAARDFKKIGELLRELGRQPTHGSSAKHSSSTTSSSKPRKKSSVWLMEEIELFERLWKQIPDPVELAKRFPYKTLDHVKKQFELYNSIDGDPEALSMIGLTSSPRHSTNINTKQTTVEKRQQPSQHDNPPAKKPKSEPNNPSYNSSNQKNKKEAVRTSGGGGARVKDVPTKTQHQISNHQSSLVAPLNPQSSPRHEQLKSAQKSTGQGQQQQHHQQTQQQQQHNNSPIENETDTDEESVSDEE